MNPDENGTKFVTEPQPVREYNWTAIILGISIAGLVIIAGLFSLIFFKTTSKIVTNATQQIQQAEVAADNPFITPTPSPYQNPFSFANTANAESNTSSYQNPFGQ